MNLEITTLAGTQRTLDPTTIADLRSRMRGPVLTAADPGYNTARRIWNAIIDKRPALIARCAGAADVLEAVRFAVTHEVLTSVRGGGHNVAGTAVCDGGLMIDLSLMKGIRVDPAARTVQGAARTVMAGIRPREAKMLHEGATVLVAVKQHETALDAASGDYGVDGLAHRNSQIGALLGVGGKIRERWFRSDSLSIMQILGFVSQLANAIYVSG